MKYDFTPTQAKVALRIAGLTQTDIAAEFGVTPQAVQYAINNPHYSARIAKRISEVIDTVNEVVSLENLRPAV